MKLTITFKNGTVESVANVYPQGDPEDGRLYIIAQDGSVEDDFELRGIREYTWQNDGMEVEQKRRKTDQ
jgi:hypothetical protein